MHIHHALLDTLIVNDYSNKLVQDIFFFVGIDSQIAMMLSS